MVLKEQCEKSIRSNLHTCPACQADIGRRMALRGRCAHTACQTDTLGHHRAPEKMDIFLLQWVQKVRKQANRNDTTQATVWI